MQSTVVVAMCHWTSIFEAEKTSRGEGRFCGFGKVGRWLNLLFRRCGARDDEQGGGVLVKVGQGVRDRERFIFRASTDVVFLSVQGAFRLWTV